jgi:hypothetical protein
MQQQIIAIIHVCSFVWTKFFIVCNSAWHDVEFAIVCKC